MSVPAASASSTFKLPVYLPLQEHCRKGYAAAFGSHSSLSQQRYEIIHPKAEFKEIGQKHENLAIEQEFENLFDQPVTFVIQSQFTPYLKEHSITNSSAYTLTGRTLTVIKQVKEKTGCATSAMMVILDQIEKRNYSLPLNAPIANESLLLNTITERKELFNEEFFKWFHTVETTNGQDLVERLKKEGCKSVLISFLRNHPSPEKLKDNEIIPFKNGVDILHALSAKIEETGNSVIVAIDHRLISGHWVIVDEICLEPLRGHPYGYVRDSYSGKAYKVSSYDLVQAIDDNSDRIEAIYVQD